MTLHIISSINSWNKGFQYRQPKRVELEEIIQAVVPVYALSPYPLEYVNDITGDFLISSSTIPLRLLQAECPNLEDYELRCFLSRESGTILPTPDSIISMEAVVFSETEVKLTIVLHPHYYWQMLRTRRDHWFSLELFPGHRVTFFMLGFP